MGENWPKGNCQRGYLQLLHITLEEQTATAYWVSPKRVTSRSEEGNYFPSYSTCKSGVSDPVLDHTIQDRF